MSLSLYTPRGVYLLCIYTEQCMSQSTLRDVYCVYTLSCMFLMSLYTSEVFMSLSIYTECIIPILGIKVILTGGVYVTHSLNDSLRCR